MCTPHFLCLLIDMGCLPNDWLRNSCDTYIAKGPAVNSRGPNTVSVSICITFQGDNGLLGQVTMLATLCVAVEKNLKHSHRNARIFRSNSLHDKVIPTISGTPALYHNPWSTLCVRSKYFMWTSVMAFEEMSRGSSAWRVVQNVVLWSKYIH